MILNGKGEVIAVLPTHLHHALDFCGDGKEEFVRAIRDADGKLYLAAYGCPTGAALPRDRDLAARRKAANHTHY